MEASAGLSYKRRRVSLDTSIKHIVVRILCRLFNVKAENLMCECHIGAPSSFTALFPLFLLPVLKW